MVPAAFVLIDAFPLTPNGKLDVRALPAPVWDASAGGDDGAAPASETETRLAEIWCQVLGIADVGRDASFFTLGGHSLLAARMVAEVRERFGIKPSVRSIFDHPTLGAFAAHVDELVGNAQPPAAPAEPVAQREEEAAP